MHLNRRCENRLWYTVRMIIPPILAERLGTPDLSQFAQCPASTGHCPPPPASVAETRSPTRNAKLPLHRRNHPALNSAPSTCETSMESTGRDVLRPAQPGWLRSKPTTVSVCSGPTFLASSIPD
jgi:hypothetical protein